MKKSTLLLLGLLVVLMAVVYIIKRPTSVEESTFSVPNLGMSFNAATLVKIELERNKQYIRFERFRDTWRITEPVRHDVDPELMNQLLTGLGNFRLTGLVSQNPEKQSIFEVNELGTTLIVTGEDGKSTSFIVGKGDQATGLHFVRPSLTNSVYLAEGLTSEILNRDLREWRARTVYKTDVASLQTVVIRKGEETFSLRRRGDRWYSEDKILPAGLMTSVLNIVGNFRADDFIDTSLVLNRSPEVRLQVAGRDVVAMDFFPIGDGGGRYFVKLSGGGPVYIITRALPADIMRVVAFLTSSEELPVSAESLEGKRPEKEQQSRIPKKIEVAPEQEKTATPEPGQIQQRSTQPVVKEAPRQQGRPGQPIIRDLSKEQQTNIESRPIQQQPVIKEPAAQNEKPVRQTPPATVQQPPQTQRTSAPVSAKYLEDNGELAVYIVRQGDTMESIATKYGVGVEDIMRWNGLKSSSVKPGAELYVYTMKK